MTRARPSTLGLAAAAIAIAAAAVAAPACSTDSSTPGPAGTATPTSAPLASYPSLQALAAALTDKGVACTLQYEALHDEGTGKRELSLCTIDGELAALTIWVDPASVTKLADSARAGGDALAYGKDWTVSVKSGPLATRIAGAAGGATVLPSAPSAPSAPATAR